VTLEILKKIWKNEYFQTVITIVILLAFVFGFWHIVQFSLGTEYPALAVASTSMVPTLNVGDLIIVQGVNPEQINAKPLTGDIVVFRDKNNPENLIVHRAVNASKINGDYEFITEGDAVGSHDQFSPWNSSMLIGKVVGRIPWIGNLALLMHSEQNIYLFVIILIILIAILVIFPFETEEGEKKNKEKMIFGKISIETIYLLILNILLIAIIIFSLWGAFTFWNPGAGTSQTGMSVTIYGMYSDVQFHKSFSKVIRADISQGFLTYTINCRTSEGLRTGVPTFSWAQAAIIVLLVFDVWELLKFLRKRRKVET
jgi:signal peptidase